MGSSRSQTVGYRTLFNLHAGVCKHADAIRRVYFDKKIAWRGYSEGGELVIDKPDLFGGEKSEGGVGGTMKLLMGASDQAVESRLQSYMGLNIPAFRGFVSSLFYGADDYFAQTNTEEFLFIPPYLTGDRFYFGNSQYVKGIGYRVQRIHSVTDGTEQWYDEKAQIGSLLNSDAALYFALDVSGSMEDRLEGAQIALSEVCDYLSDALANSDYSLDVCMGMWAGAETYSFVTYRDVTPAQLSSDGVGGVIQQQIDNFAILGNGTDFREAFHDADSFFSGTGSGYQKIMFFITDGEPALPEWSGPPFLLSDQTGNAEAAAALTPEGVDVYGINLELNEKRFTRIVDNTPGDDVPVVAGDGMRNAIAAALAGQLDMNPAHIYRELITNLDYGMKYPESDVDDTSFTAGADAFYDEGMGLSFKLYEDMPREDVLEEIKRHTDSTVFIGRTDGKFKLKLIRDDYDEGSLLVLDEDNIQDVKDYKVANLEGAINSVTVKYWNNETGEDGAVTVSDPALVQEFGRNSTTIEYQMFTNANIATRKAENDLRVFTSELSSCIVQCDRIGYQLEIADVFKLEWPEHFSGQKIMRVIDIAYGDSRSNLIEITCTEDVYSIPSNPAVGEETQGLWTDITQAPLAASYRAVEEATYYELVQALGQSDADARIADENDIGVLALAAGRPAAEINALYAVDSGAGYVESAGTIDFCAYGIVDGAYGVEAGPTVVYLSSAVDLSDFVVGQHAHWDDEIVVVNAYSTDSNGGFVTLGRGALDTVPQAHSDGSTILFWDYYIEADGVEYIASDDVDVKIMPVSGTAQYSLSSATADNVVFDSRAFRPYAPGNFKIDGLAYPAEIPLQTPIPITWSHRDRTQQTTSTIYDTTASNIGPEDGATYNARVYSLDLDSNDLVVAANLIDESTGISGTSYNWSPPGGDTETDLVDLEFSKALDVNHLDVLPSNLIELTETFASDTGQIDEHFKTTPNNVVFSFGTNELILTGSGHCFGVGVHNGVTINMPQMWIESDVEITDTGATSYDIGLVGIGFDEDNWLAASIDRINGSGQIRIQHQIGATNTNLSSTAQTFPGSFKVAFCLNANSVTVWMDTGSGWVLKCGVNIEPYEDYEAIDWTGWGPMIGLGAGGGTTEWRFSNFRYGRHGGVGIRDLTLVTNEDGTPYHPTADTVKMTCTLPDGRGSACQGVITLDLTDYSYTVDAILFVGRDSKIQNDLAAHIIYYANGDRRITISTWGNGFDATLEVLHKFETSLDLLSGSHVIESMTALSLPSSGTNPGEYDTMLAYDSDNSRWLMAYTIVSDVDFSGSPFYAAAAHSTDLSSWTAVGSDSGNQGYEGAKLSIINDAYYVVVGGPAGASTSSRVYDASDMSYLGTLDAVFEGSTQTQPHAMIFPYENKQICVSFDNTTHPDFGINFTWGNLVIYESSRYGVGGPGRYRVQIESERDGYVSHQTHQHDFDLIASST